MSGDRLAALAKADPGLSEALRQLRRGGGLHDGTGPDPLHNADVSPEVLEEFLTLAVREAPDDQVFGLAVTLPGLIHRRGAGQEALDVLLSERSLTPDERDWVDFHLKRSAQAARERGAQALVEVPPMDEQTRATTMQILRIVHAGGSRPFGYKIIRHDLGEGGRRRYRIIGEEIEPAEAEAIKEAAARVLRGESIRSIAFDFNDRGIKPVAGGRWAGSTLRRMLVSPRIAGLREHNGEIVGDAAWPAIIDHATHDRLVGLLDDPSRRRENFGRPRVHPLVGLVYCASCGGKMTTAIASRQGRGYACRKDENPICPARVRVVAEPLEAYVEGYVIDQWRNPEAIQIAQSDDDRMERIGKISAEMAELQRQKQDAFRMKLRREVDLRTFREVTREMDVALDQLAREHNRLASEAAMPELPDPSLAWEDLSVEDRRALTELPIDKIIIAPHPHKIDKNGRRHYLIRAIPYQDPEVEAARLKSVHEARVKIVPRV